MSSVRGGVRGAGVPRPAKELKGFAKVNLKPGETKHVSLQLTPRACYTRPSTETANTDAFVEVDEVTLRGEVKRIFTGWVFAASPGDWVRWNRYFGLAVQPFTNRTVKSVAFDTSTNQH